MKTMKWNGENWYCDARSPFKRARQWLIWIGGWETANKDGEPGGWRLPPDCFHRGWKCWLPRHLAESMAPVSVLGHRATFFGWGIQFKPKRHGARILVISRSGVRAGQPTRIYLSPDGTPFRATTWFRGWHSEYLRDYATRAIGEEG